MQLGFDKDKYIEMQSARIRERIDQFGGKLYLEFGGKPFDDYHASRVLPGFEPDLKARMLANLASDAEVLVALNANDIEQDKRRSDLGIPYAEDALRLLDIFRGMGIGIGGIVITRWTGQPHAEAYRARVEALGIPVYRHYPIEDYPTNVDLIVSEEGFGKNEFAKTTKPLVVVTAPGPGSGKLAVCLSQIYHEHKSGVEAGYANKPSGLDLTNLTEIYPSSILLAGSEETLKTIVSVKTETIDFSTLSNEKKTFSALAINIPEKCKNISNNATAKVTLDLSGLSKKTFDIDTFKVEGLSSDFKAEVTSKSISVTVIGTEAELNELSADNITAQIDVTDSNLKTGSVEMPVTFKFSGVNGCWAYGSYRANLNISENK